LFTTNPVEKEIFDENERDGEKELWCTIVETTEVAVFAVVKWLEELNTRFFPCESFTIPWQLFPCTQRFQLKWRVVQMNSSMKKKMSSTKMED
jgi:hypothetical protein